MAAFTANMSGTAELDSSIVLATAQGMILAATQADVVDQFATYKEDIGAKSIGFKKYTHLTPVTAALVEKDDVDSEAMADSEVVITPKEFGKSITKTKLAQLQTGGKIDLAAANLIGINMGRSRNIIATRKLEGTTNIVTADGGAESAIAADKIITGPLVNTMYNKLARSSIPGLPQAGGMYVAFMHDDVINDIRNGADAGSWTDVNKYAKPDEVLRNEVGMYKGFRIVRNNDCLVSADAGASAVDTYHSTFVGFNAFGKATSEAEHLTLTGPFDKLGRFVNVGWYGVFDYELIDTSACWKLVTAASVGANA